MIRNARTLQDLSRKTAGGGDASGRNSAGHAKTHSALSAASCHECFQVLANPTAASWKNFEAAHSRDLQSRFDSNRAPFDELAELATAKDVFLGCSCPTKKNLDVNRCHTVLALIFLIKHYPQLKIKLPKANALG